MAGLWQIFGSKLAGCRRIDEEKNCVLLLLILTILTVDTDCFGIYSFFLVFESGRYGRLCPRKRWKQGGGGRWRCGGGGGREEVVSLGGNESVWRGGER